MNTIIAKTKHEYFRVLTNNSTVFDIDYGQLQFTKYEPDHKLDDDTWFYIEKFSTQQFCIDFLTKDFISAEYNNIESSHYQQLDYLCCIQNENNHFHFQKITPSRYINKKFLSLSHKAEIVGTKTTKIILNEKPDAIYIKSEDRLFFRNLSTISSIFRGIDQLFREATDEEVATFFNSEFIKLSDKFDNDKVSKTNRKIIALTSDTLKSMTPGDMNTIISYIREYSKNDLKYDEETKKFNINDNKQLKTLLYGIEQRFYTTPIGSHMRQANSIKTIKQTTITNTPT